MPLLDARSKGERRTCSGGPSYGTENTIKQPNVDMTTQDRAISWPAVDDQTRTRTGGARSLKIRGVWRSEMVGVGAGTEETSTVVVAVSTLSAAT